MNPTQTPPDVLSAPVRLVSSVDPDEWRDLLAADPRASLFQHPAWNSRHQRFHPGSFARWLEVRDSTGGLRGGLPFIETRRGSVRAWTAGAGGTFGGPVVAGGDEAVEAALVRAFRTEQRWRVVRRELVWAQADPPVGAFAARPIEAATIDLSQGFEHFLAHQFPKKRRNECNRSDRRGLLVDTDGATELVEPFWKLYAEQARDWGVHPESAAYLRAILEEEPAARFFVALQDGEVVGGHVCFELADELFAWVGTTRRLPSTFPSSLLIREEARFAAERGMVRLDLGSSVGLTGVANYKRLLGADVLGRWLLFSEAWWMRMASALRRRGRR